VSSPTRTRPPRPFGIVVLEILAIVQGVSAFLLGLFVLFDHDDADLIRAAQMTSNQLQSYAIGAMIVGAAVFLLGLMLGRGSQVARVVFAFFAMINLATGLYAVFAFHSEQRLAGMFSTVISGIVLLILFSHRAQEYYDNV
jgi:hypothetical protein